MTFSFVLAKVAAIKSRNFKVFIAASVDTYWPHQSADTAITIERAFRYVEVSADSIFAPTAHGPRPSAVPSSRT
ncbi:hypothetical protein CKW46_07255 [Mycobacterium liflandii]|nr:hypothetical protein BB170200_05385 [Mycobacterium marinum]ULL09522.1 hypothetical protein CKW46_07255 [Mycobacterium liflandii]